MKKIIWMLLALAPLLVGALTLLGWLARIPNLVEAYPGFAPLTFNSALCFLLAGIALLFIIFSSPAGKIWQIILGLLIVVLAGLSLMESVLNVDWSIDELAVKDWLNTGSFLSRRMAPNTALSFILTGLTFIFLPFGYKKIAGISIEIMMFFLFLLGILAVCGYILKLEFLYSWYSYTHMSLPSAICFITISLVLWGVWRIDPAAEEIYQGNQDTKLILVSTAILLSVALIVGLASFVSVMNQQSSQLGETFQTLLKDKKAVFEAEVNHAFQEMKVVRNHAQFAKFTQSANNAKNNFQGLINVYLAEGFSAAKVVDATGKELASVGSFIQGAPFKEKLFNSPMPATLMWKEGWLITISNSINPDDPQSPMVVAQWPLYNIDTALANNQGLGKTSEFVVCAQDYNTLSCYSSRSNSAFLLPKNIANAFFPMDYALAGQTGVVTSHDYQQRRILAAYMPIETLGLGIVADIETAEIYQPLTNNLRIFLPVIGLAIIVGLLLLRLQVIPLVRRMVRAERELQRSNKRLTESEERYALAVRGSNTGLWDWLVGTDQVFYSPYMKTMLGYAEHEVPGSIEFFKTILHPDDNQRVFDLLRQHLEQHVPFDIEYRLKVKSGEYHWFHAAGQALWDEQGHPTRMAGSLMDITERKKIEQRSAAQYGVTRALSQAVNLEDASTEVISSICERLEWEVGAIWLVDPYAAVMRSIGFWSISNVDVQAFETATGAREFHIGEGLPGRVWSGAQPIYIYDVATDKYFLRGPEAQMAGLHSALCFPILLHNKVLGVMEFLTRRKQLPEEALIKMMMAIGTQVAQFIQRKSMEKALRESEGYKTAVLEFASDTIMTLDEAGYLLSLNPQTYELFRYPAGELIGKNIDCLIPGISQKLKFLPKKIAIEFIGHRKNNDTFPAELTISTMALDKQYVFVCIIRDITERKKIEKLKNEFISVVSHELRTPLTSIRGALGLVLGGTVGDFDEKAKKLLDIASNNCDRLLLLINDILDMEKIEAGKMKFDLKATNIDDVVEEAIEANKYYGEKYKVKLKLAQKAPGVTVNIDGGRLMQVLANLISNGIKFSKEGDEVVVAVIPFEGKVRVTVADNGPGIPEEFQHRIFEKFSQADTSTSREKGGTGLGLSISKAIVEKLGGDLGFTSKPGEPTVFYFDLPRWDEAELEVEKAKASGAILICEDDEDQAKYLKVLLQSAGFDTEVANSAEQARQLLKTKNYKLLVLDLILPDQDGITFIRELRGNEKTRSLPIVVLSMVAQTGKTLLNGEAFTVMDWLDKPVDFNKLLKAIDIIKKLSGEKSPQVLHVEDDPDTQRIISTLLQEHAQVIDVETIKEAKDYLEKENFDLVILDLLLPDGNGAELLPLLAKRQIPVIVFSAIELDGEYANYVSEALVKSETTSQQLLQMIKALLEATESS